MEEVKKLRELDQRELLADIALSLRVLAFEQMINILPHQGGFDLMDNKLETLLAAGHPLTAHGFENKGQE